MALVIWPQCLVDAYRRLLRTMCTTQVWTVASGQAAVAQLGQHRGPLLGALAAGGPEPQAPHVTVAGEIHADRDVHGPVGYLGVKGLDHDRVEPSTGQTASRGAVLPRRHVGHDRVGDLRDRLPAHADAVELLEVRPDLTGREPFRVQRDHIARQALETPAVLAVPSPGRTSPPDHAAPPARPRRSRSSPSWASSRYASSATRGPQQHDAHSPDARPSRPSRPIRGHLAHQARQQTAPAGQLHALVTGPGDQQLSPVPHRRLAGSLARRQNRQNPISHRHDPSQSAAPSRGPSDHNRYTKFLTGPQTSTGR